MTTPEENTTSNTPTVAPAENKSAPARGSRPPSRGGRSSAPRRPRTERPKPEFDQKILAIRRVTRVVAGGRRFSLAAAIAIGDRRGGIGIGTGKAIDTSLAINKAIRSARKNMITLKLTKDGSIPHDVYAKYGSAKVMIMPNKSKGMVAGSAVRDLLVLAGVKNVTSKILSGSKNKLNNARAAFLALSLVATKKPIREIIKDEAFKDLEDKIKI